MLLGGGFFAYIFIGTLYMQQVLGYSALKAGLAWLAMALSSVAFAGLSQALVTRGSARLVMAAGMAMIGGGICGQPRCPYTGGFWANLAGPFFLTGIGTCDAFIPVSIAGPWPASPNGRPESPPGSSTHPSNSAARSAIAIGAPPPMAATRTPHPARQGAAPPAGALTSGFHWAFWVCGASPWPPSRSTYLLVRRTDLAQGTTTQATPRKVPQPAPAD